jgi:hypothetical protein
MTNPKCRLKLPPQAEPSRDFIEALVACVPNRSEPETNVASGKSSPEPQDSAAGASDGAIEDNYSTLEGLLVDRLPPIGRNLKPPSPMGEAAQNPKTPPPLAHRSELLGTMALHLKAYW